MIEATEADIKRFMSYVDKLPNGCWFWSGARSRGKGNKKCYGSFRVNGKTVRAHRFAAEVLGKKFCPKGHHRDHLCSFSLCVNPDHLEIVTHEVNQMRKTDDKVRAPIVDSRDAEKLIAALRTLGYEVEIVDVSED